MFGLGSRKQEVNLRIETCSSCGMFQKHAEESVKLIESWLDPKRIALKTTINAGDPGSVQAFEVWVNGTLVHSEQQRNHGYLDSHRDDEHRESVRMAIQDVIAGRRVFMPNKRDDSEIKLNKQNMDQQKEEIAMKRRALEEAQKSKHRDEKSKNKPKPDERKQAQKAEDQLRQKAAARGKKQDEATARLRANEQKQEEAAAKRRAKDFRREQAQKTEEDAKQKADQAQVDAQRAREKAEELAKEVSSEGDELELSSENELVGEAEIRQHAEASWSTVDTQAKENIDPQFRALTKALVAEQTTAFQKQFGLSPLSSSLEAVPFSMESPRVSSKFLHTPSTTAGNSPSSSWDSLSDIEKKPLTQMTRVVKPKVVKPRVVQTQPGNSLAMLFGFACCRSSSTLEDSAGDIPTETATF